MGMISVVHWNTWKKKANQALALSDSSEYDVIAIQEPNQNAQTRSTYCPKSGRYQLVYESGSRAALYVHKRFAIATLQPRQGKDWCSITFGDGDEAITIWSIYAQPEKGSDTEWQSPITAEIAAAGPRGRNVLVGDFNLHHPLWEDSGRVSKGSEAMLAFAQRWRLALATPRGEITWKQHNKMPGTIDLAWATEDLRIIHGGTLDWHGSDHRAQLINVGIAAGESHRKTATGWNWPMMNKRIAIAESKNRFRSADEPTTPCELDEAVDALITNITEIANASTPLRKPGTGRGCSWWNKAVEEATDECKRL